MQRENTLICNYRIKKAVGYGGTSTVYDAEDCRTRTRVALKEIDPDSIEERKSAFQKEGDILSRLSHANLPRVYEAFSEGGFLYLALEFVEGKSLEETLFEPDVLSESTVMEWGLQLTRVLAYLHSQNPPIIFRDLKPSNMILTKKGTLKLIDFGIARRYVPGKPMDTLIVGTPGFSPPEQYGRGQTDSRSDIYSLGVTLYQFLSKITLADGMFYLEPIRKLRADVSPQVEKIIARATQIERNKRYQDAEEMGADIQKYMETSASAAPQSVGRSEEVPSPWGPWLQTGFLFLCSLLVLVGLPWALQNFLRMPFHLPQWFPAGGALLSLLVAAGYLMMVRRT
ncbi:MAG: serine/threonine protein kinase [Armatimonadetes bacterium]|nr:serine/threonine protein kinase [Armatimonadota bacterium]